MMAMGNKARLTMSLVVLLILSILFTVKCADGQADVSAVISSVKVTDGDGSQGLKEVMNGGFVKISMNQTPIACSVTIRLANTRFWNTLFTVVASTGSGILLGEADGFVMETETVGQTYIDLSNVWNDTAITQHNSGFVYIVITLHVGTAVEDQSIFTLKAVNNYIAVSTNHPQLEEGNSGSLLVNVSNIDTDNISDVKVSIFNSGFFLVSPLSQELAEISGSGTKNTTFSLDVPKNASVGDSNITLQVSFRDSEGYLHFVNEQAYLTVISPSPSPTLPEFPSWIIIPIALATLTALAYVKKTKKQK